MFTLGPPRFGPRRRLSRRAFLEVGFSSALGLSLVNPAPLLARGPAKAKSVILLWLWGGPSQLDTFDPKPNAPVAYRGPFAAIPTRIPGIRVGELFPKLAGAANEFTLIRSLHTHSNDHGVAGTMGLTGSGAGAVDLGGKAAGGAPRPALGATVARLRETANGLPPFMVIGGKLHQGKKMIAGESGGPLGAAYDAFRLEYDPKVGTKIPALDVPVELAANRLDDRRALLAQLDDVRRQTDALAGQFALDEHRARAFALLTSSRARELFDVAREPSGLRDHYGRTRFGQSCLLARRLVEHGVPFVQVNWSDHVEAEEDSGDGGWDHHYRNFQIMQDRHGPWLDGALSTLLSDLKQRGLLQTTLVLAVGEFGRSPKINDKAGREHWEHCYSALIAGGGVVGGRAFGESDARAERPRAHPCTPADLVATVQHAVGMTSVEAQSLNLAGTGRVLEELFQ